VPGTTTDPVEKSMELQPLGPVQLIDTAGLDDVGELGRLRVEKTRQVLERADIAILTATADGWGAVEETFAKEAQKRQVPVIIAFTQADRQAPDAQLVANLRAKPLPVVVTSSVAGTGLGDLRQALIQVCPEDFINPPAIVSDLVPPGGLVVLVVPIDKEAPKGRLILPQVQTLRDLLDGDQLALVVKERELKEALGRLTRKPDLVVTDSQAFLKVAADTPDDVPLTSFSILFARHKGDLDTFAAGAAAIDRLKPGDRVLIAESCTHHPIGEDIGRVKIPRWLMQYVGGQLAVTTCAGHDFPADLAAQRLVVHCGACTTNRREVLSRIERCREANVPITNYGLAIARSLGVMERALAPFPSALAAWREALKTG
jgi:[FeFe] hydrogenase H-cluster maturation GTPase HydF